MQGWGGEQRQARRVPDESWGQGGSHHGERTRIPVGHRQAGEWRARAE
jgi:hypothetical protein